MGGASKLDKATIVESGVITELSSEENTWWRTSAIVPFRTKFVKKASSYVDVAISDLKVDSRSVGLNVNDIIRKVRETAWGYYIKDEVRFHNEILAYLVKTRKDPSEILKKLAKENFTIESDTIRLSELDTGLPHFVGNFTGRIMPYIYPLSLSTTNSRRMRSGQTFELIIRKMFEFLGLPFQDQSMLGEDFFRKNKISKKVDFIIPSREQFLKNRPRTMIVSTKTSLRERWQEVVEELRRTGNANIHLLTVDESLSSNIAAVMSEYNIILVVYDELKKSKFGSSNNVIGFTEFFKKEIPHVLSYWKSAKSTST